ncbi:MAG: [acyl-carrier-protein] S-malonyltransferase [Gammaproteobacteria bacterium GWE2_37_16]|nr:MAG: [acyl-carrier-protein] S-malonyltransferase [Gammaproteobacteria bacterium GWE2_37_16]
MTSLNSSNTAFAFPGQGSQSLGMLAELSTAYPIIYATYDEASTVLGYDLWRLCQEGPEEKLNRTEFSQPILLAGGVAVWRAWLQQGGKKPAFLAGHSLGEYAALVCAEAFAFSDALKLVAERGRLMQEAVPVGKGAMIAIVGLSDEKILAICSDAAQGQILTPANYNSIGQTVLAGEVEAATRAVVLAKNAGAKIAKLLPVSVPSHCELMRSAAEKMAETLQDIKINSPKIPVIHNVDVAVHTEPEEIRLVLVQQLYSPVRWVETITVLAEKGMTAIIECGPGKVLTGLNRRIVSGLETLMLGTVVDFENALKNEKAV